MIELIHYGYHQIERVKFSAKIPIQNSQVYQIVFQNLALYLCHTLSSILWSAVKDLTDLLRHLSHWNQSLPRHSLPQRI